MCQDFPGTAALRFGTFFILHTFSAIISRQKNTTPFFPSLTFSWKVMFDVASVNEASSEILFFFFFFRKMYLLLKNTYVGFLLEVSTYSSLNILPVLIPHKLLMWLRAD